LSSRYLQENIINRIENLDTLSVLDTLNLSTNAISKIENLAPCTRLNTIVIANNKIKTVDDVKGLLDCPSLR